MTRSYELLQSAERDRDMLERPFQGDTGTTSTPRLDLPPLWRTEVSKLVRRLFFRSDSQPIRAVVFAELGNHDSSAWVGAHTADLLATAVSGRVCVVDANVWHPSLHNRLGASNRLGFSDLSLDGSIAAMDVAQNVDANLWLLPAGRTAQPQQVFNSSLLAPRVAELRKSFDYLLIAAPALDYLSDVIALAQCCDGLILIVRANSTRREIVLRAKHEVETANVEILGSVLTDRRFPIPQAIYSKL